jgi:hypothetical protein
MLFIVSIATEAILESDGAYDINCAGQEGPPRTFRCTHW